jgi:hypothetical protein
MQHCAGCGRDIVKGRDGRWGEVIRGTAEDPLAIDYTCDWAPGPEPGTVAWVDYHYVEGEEQRHFVAEAQ